ncbi:hypothetical protein NDU88_009636 [Pleurodeles waltl]|uniref:Uncharacterized protein n=1 Tax=Pleurodeles waltl TaxID=8319 RepID=A0AAV7PXR6_PLEWA|nr:hypothetical protein NDU88_009636 [Pleurodeles waltl]
MEARVRGAQHDAPPLTRPFTPLLPADNWEASTPRTTCLKHAPAGHRGMVRCCGSTQGPSWYQWAPPGPSEGTTRRTSCCSTGPAAELWRKAPLQRPS